MKKSIAALTLIIAIALANSSTVAAETTAAPILNPVTRVVQCLAEETSPAPILKKILTLGLVGLETQKVAYAFTIETNPDLSNLTVEKFNSALVDQLKQYGTDYKMPNNVQIYCPELFAIEITEHNNMPKIMSFKVGKEAKPY